MNFPLLNAIVVSVAAICCLLIGSVFCVIHARLGRHLAHLIFGLFVLSLSVMSGCRLWMDSGVQDRHIALLAFQWQCVAGCGAIATFLHYTCLLTDRAPSYLSPRTIYAVAALLAGLCFSSLVLHIAPYGSSPKDFDDLEIGPAFPKFAGMLISCGVMTCLALLSSIRKAPATALAPQNPNHLPHLERVAGDFIRLQRNIAPVFLATLILMVFNLIDIVWFLNPTSDLPISFSAVGTIILTMAIAFVFRP